MKLILIVGIGGFIGSVSRYLLTLLVQNRFLSTFPFGTLSVNILGCFLIGLVYALSERGNIGTEWRLFFITGILGGFTTFSSFSNETVGMLHDAKYAYATLYVGCSVMAGIAATFGGVLLIKLF